MVYAELEDDKIVIKDFEWRYKELISSVPGASFKKDRYVLPKTWPTALALKNNLGEHLSVSEELDQWMDDLYSSKILPAYQIRDVPAIEEGYDFLFPHQKADVKFLSTARRALLANDLGSGKTYSSSATIRHIAENLNEEVFPLLITCPNSTKLSWEREFKKVWPDKNVVVIDGTAAQRRKQFKAFQEEGGEVLIINWDLVRQHSRLKPYGSIALKRCVDCKGVDTSIKPTACEAHDKELNEIDFKSVIGDEVHRISDPSTKTSRAFKAATGDADIRIGLSGTPINATPDQLFSALNWLYPEAYPSKTKFLDRFCDMADSYWGGSVVTGIKSSMENEFFAGLNPILRRMPKEVILPFLPPVSRVRREVEMGAKQAKAYKQMSEKMIAEIGDEDVVVTTSPLVRLLRLLQFASAYVEITTEEVPDPNSPFPDQTVTKETLTLSDPSSKLDAFMEDLPDYGDSSIVVFAQHKQLINLLAKRMDKADIQYGLITGDQSTQERQAYMDAFQDGRLKYILCTIQAGGTGITLTKADTMVFLQRSYSMIDNVQAEGRAHRIGSEQHENITIVDYISKGTVDDAVIEAVDLKKDNLEYLLRDKELIEKFMHGILEIEDE